jgi:hypothetical protein
MKHLTESQMGLQESLEEKVLHDTAKLQIIDWFGVSKQGKVVIE